MYCTKCGVQNDDNSYKCVKCGEVLQHAHGPVIPLSVPNYLVQAIMVTLCCCLPFGIVSIVYAAQANAKVKVGDLQGAMEASSKAKTWCWVGFGIGLASAIIYFMLVILIPPPHPGY